MAMFQCKNCGAERKVSIYTSNKYCSNKCQHEYQTNSRIQRWVKDGIGWTVGGQIPDWVKRYLTVTRGYACEICGIHQWNGKRLVLEVDHIDGLYYNNRPENLRLICPNCHSQTDTFKGKNKGKGPTLNKAPEA